jgi:orotate phosphoribosyltransferase-like protein
MYGGCSEQLRKEGSSIMSKDFIVIKPRSVYKQIVALQSTGKTELEIASLLGITPSTVRYVTLVNLPDSLPACDTRATSEDQRLKSAYEMRQRGKSFAEISQKLQVNMQRVRRMVHRYDWILRQSK